MNKRVIESLTVLSFAVILTSLTSGVEQVDPKNLEVPYSSNMSLTEPCSRKRDSPRRRRIFS